MENILAQLRQRQIFKVATIYVVSAWPLVQIADVAIPALGLPDTVLTLLLKVFLVGFPISLIFAWLINFTSKGLVRVHSDDNGETGQESSLKINVRAFATVAGSLVLALMLTLGSQLLLESPNTDNPLTTDIAATEVFDPQGLLASGHQRSIAVLAFDVLSNDPEDEFFIDGMVEELLNLLAKIPELKVAARTSSFSYKGVNDKTIIEIGQELGVDTILEGSIRKNDVSNRIRVVAQLIEASTGGHIWSETYDREYRDIFQIQDEIANAVADKMEATLLGVTPKVQFVSGTHNVDAMVEYGKGQKELAHRTAPSIEKALQHFQTAAAKDTNYARAYVGISDANILLALYGSLPKETAAAAAQQALDTALRLNSQLGSAHASQGLLFSELKNSEQAELSFKRAIELNPNYAMAYMWYGSLMQSRGDLETAHQLFNKAFELDPKSPVAAFNVAWGHYQLGEDEKAMEWFSKIIANDPYYPGAYLLVGDIVRNRGRLDESIGMYKRALKVDRFNKSAVNGLLFSTMDMQDFEATDQWFAYLDENPTIFSDNERKFIQTRYLACRGELEKAIDLLKQIKFGSEEIQMRLFIDAEIAFYRQDYVTAITAYERLRKTDVENKQFFFHMAEGQAAVHLAYSYKQSDQKYKASELILEFDRYSQKGKNKKATNPRYYYNMALVNALLDNENESFNYLQGAIESGWVQVCQGELEPIFKKMAIEPRFGLMMGGIRAKLANMRNKVIVRETHAQKARVQ